jgi:hypothetical protein
MYACIYSYITKIIHLMTGRYFTQLLGGYIYYDFASKMNLN